LGWIIIFIVSLAAVVKGADWLLDNAEKIGLALGLSPFVVGVVITGVGTSLPELASSVAAVLRGATEIVVANAAGSNIANILLVIGISAVVARGLRIDKDLIDLDLPLIAISTVLFVGVVFDGTVNLVEAIVLLGAYGVHLAYTFLHQEELSEAIMSVASRKRRGKKALNGWANGTMKKFKTVRGKDFIQLLLGFFLLIVGARFLIDSVIEIAGTFQIATAAIAIVAIAVGTSLPELLVSAKAAKQGKSEIAIGNIFGSNAFNILVVVGLPGVFTDLTIDHSTLTIGVPALVLVTFLFVISGISKRIHFWEGAMYSIAYLLFVGKIFNLF